MTTDNVTPIDQHEQVAAAPQVIECFNPATGEKLGELFDKAAGIIDDHYFDVLFGELQVASPSNDRDSLLAGLYAIQGDEIAEYYRQRSWDIHHFYAGETDLSKMLKTKTGSSAIALGKTIEGYYQKTYRSKQV